MFVEILKSSLYVVVHEHCMLALGLEGIECLQIGSYCKSCKTHWAQKNQKKKIKNYFFFPLHTKIKAGT